MEMYVLETDAESCGRLCISGMQALLSVLDKFRVENRRNMFVIKETRSGAIFYIRFRKISSLLLFERFVLCVKNEWF